MERDGDVGAAHALYFIIIFRLYGLRVKDEKITIAIHIDDDGLSHVYVAQ